MIIKNGIVADPASGLYEQMDILVKDGKIVKIAPDISCASDAAATEKEEIIDAAGMASQLSCAWQTQSLQWTMWIL